MADVMTARERLIEVDKALSHIRMGGQSYQIGSRRLTRANYSDLLKERKELQAEVSADESTGLMDDTYVSVFEGR